ncbi:MAG: tannase/feruloyl esterase family alpha/beta hydrolase [Sphingobacteriaceae bacterium]
MKILKLSLFPFIVLLVFSCSVGQTANEKVNKPHMSVEELKNIRLPDVRISKVEQIREPVRYCKVTGVIGKEINFELLLPNSWNSRFAMGGGGGFVGSVQNSASSSVIAGYATVGTDTGHEGADIKADWALNNMERQVNFGHLAVHRTAVTAKEIIRQYYRSEISYSYFLGCSRGGGQAMMEAQRYPEDFDGIVAGAPAFSWPAIGAKFIQNSQAIYPNPKKLDAPVITLANLKLLQAKVLEQFDSLDGLKDGILNDPKDDKLDFNKLPVCPDNVPADDCFTAQQLAAIKVIYSGVLDGQQVIYPGFPLGAENEPMGWHAWITGPLPLNMPSLEYGFGNAMYKYLIFQDSTWDYSTYDFSNYSATTQYASSYLDATSSDYSEFKKRGGRMIIYHGWNDPALSAYATINYYEKVKGVDRDVENYIRLFLLPGVLHCGGGPGPSNVDWMQLISGWVEKRSAPDSVILSRMEKEKVVMARPVFPYPDKAIYKGKGDPNKSGSFKKANNNK